MWLAVEGYQIELIPSVPTLTVDSGRGRICPRVVNLVQQNRTAHLEPGLRQLTSAGSVSSYLGVLLHTLEAHEGAGAQGMAYNSRGGAYVDAVGLARGWSHAIPPWPDQKVHEANTRLRTRLWRHIFW